MSNWKWKHAGKRTWVSAALALVLAWGTFMPYGASPASAAGEISGVVITDSAGITHDNADAFLAALGAGLDEGEWTASSRDAFAEAAAAVQAAVQGTRQDRMNDAVRLAELAREGMRPTLASLGTPDWQFAGPGAFSGNAVSAGASKGGGAALTVAFTMRADQLKYQVPIDKLPLSGSAGWTIKLRNNGDLWFRIGSEGSNNSTDVPGAYSAGTPVHIAATFAGGTAKVYINGELKAQKSGISQTVGNTVTSLQLGRPSVAATGEFLTGSLQDVYLFDKALEADEIGLLAEADKSYLNYRIEAALLLNETDYAEGWAALTGALSAAQAVNGATAVAQTDIDAAALALREAEQALEAEDGIAAVQVHAAPSGPVKWGEPIAAIIASSANDAEGVALGALGVPAGAAWDAATGQLDWTPTEAQAGNHDVVFTAEKDGRVAYRLVRITVAAAPQLAAAADLAAVAGKELTFRVPASDLAGLPLSYSAALPDGAVLNPATGQLTWTPQKTDYGRHEFVLTVGNGLYSSDMTVAIAVDLPLVEARGYTKGSYYVYAGQADALKAAMLLPGADKTALAAELAAAEAELESSAGLAVQAAVTADMVEASHLIWSSGGGTGTKRENGWRAFDGNLDTATDTQGNPSWILVDFGENGAGPIDYMRFHPRTGGKNYERMNNAVIEGSHDGQTFVPLYTFGTVTQAAWLEVRLLADEAYRYIRYSTASGNANVAEIQLYAIGLDATLLELLADEANALDEELYSEESFAAASAAMLVAEELLSQPGQATQAAVDAASQQLLAALGALESRYAVSLQASLTGPTWSRQGAPIALSVGVSGDEFAFTALDITMSYDPAAVAFPMQDNGDGGFALTPAAIASLKDGLNYLDSSVSEQSGKIRMLLMLGSEQPVAASGKLFDLVGRVKADAPLGQTEIRLLDMQLVTGEELDDITLVKADAASARLSVNLLAATDKSSLGELISQAETKRSEAKEGEAPDQYPADAIAALGQAIAAANATVDDLLASAEEVQAAAAALAQALEDFAAAKNPADATSLTQAIAIAEAKLARTAEGDKVGQYAAGSKTTLVAAVQAARQTAANTGATQVELAAALAELQNKYEQFRQLLVSMVPGQTELSVADLAIVVALYGKQAGDEGWTEAAKADVASAGRMDIADITTIAKMILNEWNS